MIVQRKRHIAKTISYRILSTLIGFILMWWISGSIKVGAAFGVAELIYKPIQYYIFLSKISLLCQEIVVYLYK
jgi:uncharacterized membrane protein